MIPGRMALLITLLLVMVNIHAKVSRVEPRVLTVTVLQIIISLLNYLHPITEYYGMVIVTFSINVYRSLQ